MAYVLIEGHFIASANSDRVQKRDGHSASTVHFRPSGVTSLAELHDPSATLQLSRPPAAAAPETCVVRLEGLEALEVSYRGNGQASPFAQGARDQLMEALGPWRTQTGSSELQARGYLLSRNVDSRGRIIAFCFAGAPPIPDGERLFVTAEHVKASVNAKLLREGLAYASFYDSLPAELRTVLAQSSRSARGYNLGLWPHAVATTARKTKIPNLRSLSGSILFPKLFRRLVEYFELGHDGLEGFETWLCANPHRNELLILPNQEIGHLHQVLQVEGGALRMTRNTEDFVVIKAATSTPSRAPRPGPLRIVAAQMQAGGASAGARSVTILNTTASPVALHLFTLRNDRGAAVPLEGQLAPGEAKRISMGPAGQCQAERWALALCRGPDVVDRVALTRSQAAAHGASVVF